MGVLQGVALQQGAVGEGPVAHVALKGALGTVGAHVHVQRAFLGEALAAHGALEGPDASVHHHVFEEVVAQGEGAPADGALMRFLTCRDRFVQADIQYIQTNKDAHKTLVSVQFLCSSGG